MEKIIESIKNKIGQKILEEQIKKQKIFFTSDLHINDNRLNLYGRDLIFNNEKEVNEYIVKVFNENVSKSDLTYFLGDISMDEEGFEIIKKLNGKKILIKGNYDISKVNGGTAKFEINDKFLLKYFDEVYDELEIKIGKETVYLNHFPINAKENCMNIVGHVHGIFKVSRNMINVGVDANHFSPLSEEKIEFQINGIRNHYDQNCFPNELISSVKNINGSVKVLRAPEYNKTATFEENPDFYCFFAGPIQGTNSEKMWQEEFIEKIQNELKDLKINRNIVLCSPRRLEKPKNFSYEEQVDWESYYLEKSAKQGIIVFWLAKEEEKIEGRSFAQTTRWELAEWWTKSLHNNVKIILGADKEFDGQRYITYKFNQTNPNFIMINSKKDMIEKIVKEIKENI